LIVSADNGRDALLSERDGLRARGEQLEAALREIRGRVDFETYSLVNIPAFLEDAVNEVWSIADRALSGLGDTG
jgi:hypothetical protein